MTTNIMKKLEKQHIDTLVHGRWIIPVEPEKTVLENHCIAVDHDNMLLFVPVSMPSAAIAPSKSTISINTQYCPD